MKTSETSTNRNILVAVDVQNDFISGSLAVKDGEQVVDPLNRLAKAVRASIGRVAFTRDWHPAHTPHFDTWPVHCVAETEGAAFHKDLDVRTSDLILSKGMGQTNGYSGMEGVAANDATLETLIQPTNTQETVHIFIGGLATDYCVKATSIDAASRFADTENVEVYAIRDTMRAVNLQPHDGELAVAEMASAGVKIIDLDTAFELIDNKRLER